MAVEQASRTPTAGPDNNTIVRVNDVRMHFPVTSGIIFQRRVGEVKAVDGVQFEIRRGETLGLVGESGCGKTTLGRAILMLYRPTAGEVEFEGQNLTRMRSGDIRRMRRRMQMIFQDPYASLNPRMSIGSIIAEPIVIHGLAKSRGERRERVQELMRPVGLNPYYANRYPHEFSGGQRQRIGVARALAVQPSFIVADEPVSALDVSIQAQIINLLADLQQEHGISYLFISHDLGVVEHISHEVAVMYMGRIMEMASREQLYAEPLHPYTRLLLAAIPSAEPATVGTRRPRRERAAAPAPAPGGCPFHPRCQMAEEQCRARMPELREVGPGHYVRCFRA